MKHVFKSGHATESCKLKDGRWDLVTTFPNGQIKRLGPFHDNGRKMLQFLCDNAGEVLEAATIEERIDVEIGYVFNVLNANFSTIAKKHSLIWSKNLQLFLLEP